MLLELLVNIFFGIATFVISLIPDISFPQGFTGAISSVSSVMNGVAYVMPMGTLMACISVFFVLHNMTMIISIANWIIRKIPGVN